MLPNGGVPQPNVQWSLVRSKIVLARAAPAPRSNTAPDRTRDKRNSFSISSPLPESAAAWRRALESHVSRVRREASRVPSARGSEFPFAIGRLPSGRARAPLGRKTNDTSLFSRSVEVRRERGSWEAFFPRGGSGSGAVLNPAA